MGYVDLDWLVRIVVARVNWRARIVVAVEAAARFGVACGMVNASFAVGDVAAAAVCGGWGVVPKTIFLEFRLRI